MISCINELRLKPDVMPVKNRHLPDTLSLSFGEIIEDFVNKIVSISQTDISIVFKFTISLTIGSAFIEREDLYIEPQIGVTNSR